jgi:hypothetical protein
MNRRTPKDFKLFSSTFQNTGPDPATQEKKPKKKSPGRSRPGLGKDKLTS